jgi:phospholipase/carboxylesterase
MRSVGVAEAAGFYFEQINPASRRTPPLVLLHGSSGSETSLMDFAHSVAPGQTAFFLRGGVPWEDGYAFFQRNPDRTLDREDLDRRSSELCGFLAFLDFEGHERPWLVGYSNGAIMAAAAVLKAPELSSGAILLRPLSPHADDDFPPLHGYPVLLLGGATDERRAPSDTPHLAEQFRRSGALVSEHLLPTGHAESHLDRYLVRAWLADQTST